MGRKKKEEVQEVEEKKEPAKKKEVSETPKSEPTESVGKESLASFLTRTIDKARVTGPVCGASNPEYRTVAVDAHGQALDTIEAAIKIYTGG